MNCDLARTEMVAYLRHELDARSSSRLESHLAGCPDCRRELQEARRVLEWTEAASEEGTVHLIDELFHEAAAARASDLHFETERDGSMRIRLRVDGVLNDVRRVDAPMRAGVLARLKTLADMNVSETRVAQDGRIQADVGSSKLDLRVTVCPFLWGENATIRLLDSSRVLVGLEHLGFPAPTVAELDALVHQPSGFIIVSGPTGSGKTTVLYSMLLRIDSVRHKIVSVEDPVEYALPGVSQSAVNRKAGHTFGAALRSFMRQDPDVIMVGEQTDLEALTLSMQAALTGHLVLTTMHAKDAPAVIRRLRDVGAEDFMAAASLIGITAQRLVRTVCQDCKHEAQWRPEDPAIRALGITAHELTDHVLYAGRGCEKCRGTGYRGRAALIEVMRIDRDLSTMIADGIDEQQIVRRAMEKGFSTMWQDGHRQVLAGTTTPDEVFRVLAW